MRAYITVSSGNGGKGCISFKKTRGKLGGGPDGGNGGKGGDVIFKVDTQVSSLKYFLAQKNYSASHGESGKNRNRHGKDAPPLILYLPPGTILYDEETEEVLFKFLKEDDIFVAAKGGNGGKGNVYFATSTNQAPFYAQEGKKGTKRRLKLVLKLPANISIIGQPSSGKSMLLSKLTNANPKIADYPFTTKEPCAGVTKDTYKEKLLIVELPGIIKDSHKVSGLGLKFLRHAERAECILYLLDLSRTDLSPIETYHLLNKEISHYNSSLLEDKVKIVVLNKMDLKDIFWNIPEVVRYFKEKMLETFIISALTGEGIDSLLYFFDRLRDKCTI